MILYAYIVLTESQITQFFVVKKKYSKMNKIRNAQLSITDITVLIGKCKNRSYIALIYQIIIENRVSTVKRGIGTSEGAL